MFTVGYQRQFQDFAECLATGRRPQSDLALALDVTAATYTAYLSDERQGQQVDVPLL